MKIYAGIYQIAGAVGNLAKVVALGIILPPGDLSAGTAGTISGSPLTDIFAPAAYETFVGIYNAARTTAILTYMAYSVGAGAGVPGN